VQIVDLAEIPQYFLRARAHARARKASIRVTLAEFERTCLEAKKTTNELLQQLLGPDADVEGFWRRVKENLESANIRLLFVADVIPPELRRVVEFLNAQMKQVEVLAIELRQFQSKELKAIVPTVYGQTQAAAQKRVAGRTWDETSLFDKLSKSVDANALEIGKSIYEWMRNDGKRRWSSGPDSSTVLSTQC
jgi:hypothetical protein